MRIRRISALILAILVVGACRPGFSEPPGPPVANPEPPTSGAASTPTKATDTETGKSSAIGVPRERSPRVLLVIKDDCMECDSELSRLRLANGTFDELKRQRWTIGETPDCHVQIVNVKQIPKLVRKLSVQKFPTVACLANGEIIRSFTDGCRTPLDEWTFGWLLHGRDERDEPLLSEDIKVDWTGHYPLRGNHWSVEGEWLPSFEYVLEHMRGENHLTQVPSNWPIETWSYEELRSLHDDVHENDGIPRHPLKTYTLPPPLPELKHRTEPTENTSTVASPVTDPQDVTPSRIPGSRPGQRVQSQK